MQKYVYKKYDPKVVNYFVLEKRKIAKSIGVGAIIEHVGSTAVPGLGGKGILDIMVGVTKAKINAFQKQLEKAGYEFRAQASFLERRFFRKDYLSHNGQRRVHIHLTEFNGRDWQETLTFRDYLLNNPGAVQEYARIKKEAVKMARGNGEAYKKYKERFISSIKYT